MEKVRRLRLKAGMKAVDLAKRAEIDPRHLWSIESGRTKNPKAETLRLLANALNTTVDNLLADDRALTEGH